MSKSNFEWDEAKNIENQRKHGVSFNKAQFSFMDEKRVIAEDLTHSQEESRYYCFGLNQDNRNPNCSFYLSFWVYPNFRCRLMAKREKTYEQKNSI